MFIFFSCGQPSDRKPENILSQGEMVRVLSEVYITEEKVNRLALNPDSALKVFDILQDHVFEATGVPDSVFKRSYNYYMDHPIEMEKVYSALVDSLQLREQRVRPGIQ